MNDAIPEAIVFGAVVVALLIVAGWRLRVFDGIRPTGILLIVLTVFHGLGALTYELTVLRDDVDLAVTMFWVQGLVFAGFIAGIWLADLVHPPQRDMAPASEDDRREPVGNMMLLLIVATGAALLLTFEMVRRGGVDALTQFASSEGEAVELTTLRREVNQAGAYTYLAALLGYGVLPPLALALLLFGVQVRKSWAIAWGGALCAAVTFGKAATLHKSPTASWLAVMVLGFWIRRGIRVSWRKIGILAAVLFSFLASLYSFIYGITFTGGLWAVWDRVTSVPQYCLSLFLKTFPKYHDYMWGHSIRLYHSLVSDEPFVAAQQNVQLYIGSRASTPNAMWAADGWADFGWVGVAVMSLLAGFSVRWLESRLLALPKTPLSMAGYAFLTVSAISLASISVPSALLTGGIGTGALTVMLLWWVRPKSGAGLARVQRPHHPTAAAVASGGSPDAQPALGSASPRPR